MSQVVPKSRSRKVNGYVKAMLALEAVRRKRDDRYDRYLRALDQKRDRLTVAVATRRRTLTGGQQAEARWIVGAIPTVNAFKAGQVMYEVPGLEARMPARRATGLVSKRMVLVSCTPPESPSGAAAGPADN